MKSWPRKVMLTLKGLVNTINVTSVNALCELVLILNDWQKLFFLCPVLPAETEMSTQKTYRILQCY